METLPTLAASAAVSGFVILALQPRVSEDGLMQGKKLQIFEGLFVWHSCVKTAELRQWHPVCNGQKGSDNGHLTGNILPANQQHVSGEARVDWF